MNLFRSLVIKIKCYILNKRENSDKQVIKNIFKRRMGYELNLNNPKTFNEKLNWLKLYDRKKIYTSMADKYLAKKYVAKKIGEEHVIPTLGVYKRFEQINFEQLPNSFVIKCTHDSGGVVICRDKKNFDIEQAKAKIKEHLNRNYFYHTREWPYKHIRKKIMIEKFMSQENDEGLVDYKFYCFNGKPKFLYVSKGLENHETASISFLNLDWTFAPYERIDYKPLNELPSKPKNFGKMIEYATILSKGMKFLRVDLYEIYGKVYFSELTFSPCSGYMKFKNPEHDLEVGNFLKL